MSANSKIEWCDATVNFWWGCTKVSPGCAHCYADSLAHRWGKDIWGKGKQRENHLAGAVTLARKLNRQALREGRRLRVFCSSMADIFDDEVPIEWLTAALATIHECQNLDWLLLTKRPENWHARVSECSLQIDDESAEELSIWVENWLDGDAPHNVWIGTSVEDQTRADERIPKLLEIPAKIRFLSCEPLLGPVEIEEYVDDYCDGGYCLGSAPVHWVIVGGESGSKARPMHIEWAARLANQCADGTAACFVKQLGAVPVTENANMFDWPDHVRLHAGKADDHGFAFAYIGLREGKGGDWNEWPEELRVREFPIIDSEKLSQTV